MKIKIKIMAIITIIFSVLSCFSMIFFFACQDGTPFNVIFGRLVLMVGFIACSCISGSCVDALRKR